MLIALSMKNKLGFEDGSIEKPEGTDSDVLSSWTRNNNVDIFWILNSVSKEISASIIYVESAHELWLDLKESFQLKYKPRIFQLKHELMSLAQDQNSVSIYFTKLKTTWEELSNYRPVCSCSKCTCGGVKNPSSYYQIEYVMSFLIGLNDSYSQVRGQLLFMDPLPSTNKAFALISPEEDQRKITSQVGCTSDPVGSMTFTVKSYNAKRPGIPNSGTIAMVVIKMILTMEVTKARRKRDLFVLIATSMAIRLIDAMRFMATHLVTK